jgi:hypothetical protein
MLVATVIARNFSNFASLFANGFILYSFGKVLVFWSVFLVGFIFLSPSAIRYG